MKNKIFLTVIILALGITACVNKPQASTGSSNLPETALAIEGPVLLTGSFDYTNEFVLETYYVEHAVMLTDLTSFILRDLEWELPVESQVLGYLDVDEDANRATYRLALEADLRSILLMACIGGVWFLSGLITFALYLARTKPGQEEA
jgi:hypothetical protein